MVGVICALPPSSIVRDLQDSRGTSQAALDCIGLWSREVSMWLGTPWVVVFGDKAQGRDLGLAQNTWKEWGLDFWVGKPAVEIGGPFQASISHVGSCMDTDNWGPGPRAVVLGDKGLSPPLWVLVFSYKIPTGLDCLKGPFEACLRLWQTMSFFSTSWESIGPFHVLRTW